MILKNLPLMLTLITTISVTSVNSMVVETANQFAINDLAQKSDCTSEVECGSGKDTASGSDKGSNSKDGEYSDEEGGDFNNLSAEKAQRLLARMYPIPNTDWNDSFSVKGWKVSLLEECGFNYVTDAKYLSENSSLACIQSYKNIKDNICDFAKLCAKYTYDDITASDNEYLGALNVAKVAVGDYLHDDWFMLVKIHRAFVLKNMSKDIVVTGNKALLAVYNEVISWDKGFCSGTCSSLNLYNELVYDDWSFATKKLFSIVVEDWVNFLSKYAELHNL